MCLRGNTFLTWQNDASYALFNLLPRRQIETKKRPVNFDIEITRQIK